MGDSFLKAAHYFKLLMKNRKHFSQLQFKFSYKRHTVVLKFPLSAFEWYTLDYLKSLDSAASSRSSSPGDQSETVHRTGTIVPSSAFPFLRGWDLFCNSVFLLRSKKHFLHLSEIFLQTTIKKLHCQNHTRSAPHRHRNCPKKKPTPKRAAF